MADKDRHLLGACWVPGTFLHILCVLTHSTLMATYVVVSVVVYLSFTDAASKMTD